MIFNRKIKHNLIMPYKGHIYTQSESSYNLHMRLYGMGGILYNPWTNIKLNDIRVLDISYGYVKYKCEGNGANTEWCELIEEFNKNWKLL